MEMNKNFETLCIHSGNHHEQFGSLTTPIYQTATFSFASTDAAAAAFATAPDSFIYTRTSNPSLDSFEKRLAAIEHGEYAVAFASGMGAIAGVFYTLLKSGDHIICSKTLYSATHHLIHNMLTRVGIQVTVVDTTDLAAVEAAVRAGTKFIYFETPANPTMDLTDIAGIVDIAKQHNILTISDNTFASPYITNPLDMGVDIVVHSCTKYICGHGDAVSGVAVTNHKELAIAIRLDGLMHLGAVMAPSAAFLLERGIKTMGLRVAQHSKNALEIAAWLEKQPWVSCVRYPFLPSDPDYSLAKKQMRAGGGIVTFTVSAGLEASKALMNHLKLCKIAVSLGDCETLVEHAASMTHASVPSEERLASGITDGLIRMSVGLENVKDLIGDISQASAYITSI